MASPGILLFLPAHPDSPPLEDITLWRRVATLPMSAPGDIVRTSGHQFGLFMEPKKLFDHLSYGGTGQLRPFTFPEEVWIAMISISQLLNPVTTAPTHAGSSQGASSLPHSSAPIHSHPDRFLEHHLSKGTLCNLEARLSDKLDTEGISSLVDQALEAIKKGEMTRRSNDGPEARYSTKDGLAVETRFTGQVEAGEPAYDFLSIHPKSGTGQPVYLDSSSSFAAASEPGSSAPGNGAALAPSGQRIPLTAGTSSPWHLMNPLPAVPRPGKSLSSLETQAQHTQGYLGQLNSAWAAPTPTSLTTPTTGSKRKADDSKHGQGLSGQGKKRMTSAMTGLGQRPGSAAPAPGSKTLATRENIESVMYEEETASGGKGKLKSSETIERELKNRFKVPRTLVRKMVKMASEAENKPIKRLMYENGKLLGLKQAMEKVRKSDLQAADDDAYSIWAHENKKAAEQRPPNDPAS